MPEASVVDSFCGIGGLTHGFVQEGLNVVAGIDVDPSCRYAYETNNGASFIERSIDDIEPEEIVALYPEGDVKVLVGCAPCQPFSKYTYNETEGEDYELVNRFAELIIGVQPEVVSMENVPEFAEHEIFEDFIQTLEEEDYHWSSSIVDCAYYGVPQHRKRLVLFASKFGDIKIVGKTHYPSRFKTVRTTIANLPPIEAGQSHPEDPIHLSSRLSELNLRRIQNTLEGGTWKDWPEDLRLECHKKETGQGYASVYGRMSWDEPAPTMTTQCNGLGNGRFGHPEQDRAVSLREAALIQTFPLDYEFLEPEAKVVIKTLARQIGNAVPPRLGRIIARSIKRHLMEYDCQNEATTNS